MTSQNRQPRTENRAPRTQNPEPRTQNPEPRTQNPEPRTQNPEPRTQNPEPRTQNHYCWGFCGGVVAELELCDSFSVCVLPSGVVVDCVCVERCWPLVVVAGA